MRLGDMVKIRHTGHYGLIFDMDDPRKVRRPKPERAFWFEPYDVGLVLEVGMATTYEMRTNEARESEMVKVSCPGGVGYFTADNLESYLQVVG